jgi:hypothetical protein
MSATEPGNDIPANEQPDSERRRKYEALGVRLFALAPEGFDPITATPRELLAYGYPARPDALRHPRQHELWMRTMSRPIRLIEPELVATKKRSRGPRRDYGKPAGGWCGSIAYASSVNAGQPNAPVPESVQFVMGQWTVPHIAGPKPGSSICSCWIGIDGANSDSGSNDILQAGTTQQILENSDGGGDYGSFAWYEWFPGDSAMIMSPAVSPGDTVFCTICASSPAVGVFHLLNVTTGIGTAFILTPPTTVDGLPLDIKLVGDTVEWVIEVPTDENLDLARFGNIFFDECIAGTSSGYTILGGKGTLVSMLDVAGKTIATATARTDELIMIQYTDASP